MDRTFLWLVIWWHLQGNLFEAARGGCWGLVLWLLLGLLALSVVTDCSISVNFAKPIQSL